MAALLAHSIGAGFSNVNEAPGTLLARRRRPPGPILYGRRRRQFPELRAARTAQNLEESAAPCACDLILLYGVRNDDKKIGL